MSDAPVAQSEGKPGQPEGRGLSVTAAGERGKRD